MSIATIFKATDPKIGFLRSVPGFSGVHERELAPLASLFDEVRVAAGDVLVHEGDPGRQLVLIIDGEAVETRGRHALATVGPGELVGEMAVFGRAPSAATVTALTPMLTLIAGPESFGTLLTHPAMLRRLATTLAGRVRALQEGDVRRRPDSSSVRAIHSASTSNGMRRYAPQCP